MAPPTISSAKARPTPVPWSTRSAWQPGSPRGACADHREPGELRACLLQLIPELPEEKEMRTIGCALSACVLTSAWTVTAHAAEEPFPNKPVRLVIGFAPGGGTDTTARALSQK